MKHVLSMLVLIACASCSQSLAQTRKPERPDSFICIAGWYGDSVGRRTADGTIYNPSELTVASPNLPFGTAVRLTNLGNHKRIRATVNDRGPYVRGRCIDVSRGVATHLGFIKQGTARILVEVLK